MQYRTVTERIGEYMGPVDWSHPTACEMPDFWHDAEQNPHDYVLGEYAWPVIKLGMYDGWPYWVPTPAVLVQGPLGAEWKHFNSYNISQNSMKLTAKAMSARQSQDRNGLGPQDASAVAESDLPNSPIHPTTKDKDQ